MEMSGEYRIAAPREQVWAALNDPEVLKQAIPGCQELEKTSDTEFTAKVKAKVGPVSATFSGKVNLSDINPPESYTIAGEGQGGAAGFAKGSAEVRLTEDGGATVLNYDAKAQVGGKLAQIGSRLIGGTAQKIADQFFSGFSELVAPSAAEAAAPTAAEEQEMADAAMRGAALGGTPPEAGTPRAGKGVPLWLWIGGLVVVVALLLLLFGGGS